MTPNVGAGLEFIGKGKRGNHFSNEDDDGEDEDQDD